ncbi:hypothetical protein NFX46_04580 [Streptomyces phaeoluteigriseus]|uniref:PBS lyase n=1 Tax=Streptomyces phaeoluteigriseus TaxID=114686 RepID=A0ABY4Z3D1_9ACTN|nr:hypothetical protein [Streptomyces phaeoluteigriseus]USQ83118.1 hypothetical protein NFX46_04580 [Streptomyces phaeoluteigriseus]
MSLVDLIAQADERGLAASGLACLDRCVPLLGGDDEILRPLWGNLTEASDTADWGGILDQIRGKLGDSETDGDSEADGDDEAVLLARRMLAAAPAERTGPQVRVWADACSVASLQIHRLLDPADDPATLDSRRAGRTEAMPPLAAAELRRQITVLEVLAEHGAGGLRRALEVSVEGRRVLRAVVSRRARGRK